MHIPTALNLHDIESETLQVLDPAGHAPQLGVTLTGCEQVRFDLDDADHSPAFALAGEIGCGKTLTLTTIARRFADTGGRAAVLNMKEQGTGDLLHESGLDADVTVLEPSPGGSLRFPLLRLFEPPDGASDQQIEQGARNQERLLLEFVLYACQPGRGRWPADIEACIRSAIRDFIASTTARARSVDALLEVLDDYTSHWRLPGSGERIADRLRFLREESALRLVLGDGDGPASSADHHEFASAAGVLVLDVSALGQMPAAPGNARGGELAGASDALRAVLLLWAERLATNFGSPPSESQTKSPALVGIEQALFYSRGMSRNALDRIIRTSRTSNLKVGLTAEKVGDLRDYRDYLGHWLIGREQCADELRQACGWLGLDASSEVYERVGELPDGAFLYRDPHRRVGLVQVDPICRKTGQR